MNAARLRMSLLVDNNVPDEIADLFRVRRHEVYLVREEAGFDLADPDIAQLADDLRAIVVTWDKDFHRLISRAAIGTRQPYRYAGRLSYIGIRYGFGRQRTDVLLPSIEFEFSAVQRLRDQRLIMTIRRNSFTVER